jgi:phage host-nuclease inhibitor protein Gam
MTVLECIDKLNDLREIVHTLKKVLDFMDDNDRFSLHEMDIIAEIKEKYEKEIENLENKLNIAQIKL